MATKKGWHHVDLKNGNEIFMMYCPGCDMHGFRFVNNRVDEAPHVTPLVLSKCGLYGILALIQTFAFNEKSMVEE